MTLKAQTNDGMADQRSARWALIAAGALCVIAAVLIVAPPYVVRYLLQDYLSSYGIQARIGNIDANIFTGQLRINDVHGQGPNGDQARIGQLALNIDYLALFDKHIDLERVALFKARLPVRQSADQGLQVLGIPLSSSQSKKQSQSAWGFGVGDAELADVVLHYRGPERKNRPAIVQQVTVPQASAGRFATWQPNQSTPINLQLAVADGQLKLKGHVSPLAPKRGAQVKLTAQRFPMPALAPLARIAGWQGLSGSLDAHQDLNLSYDAKQGLNLDIKGQTRWQQAHVTTSGDTRLDSQRLAWDGQTHLTLWEGGQPGHAEAQGKLDIAALKIRRPNQLHFIQNSARWQGKANISLADQATRLTTHGDLTATGTTLESPGWLSLSSDQESLHGQLNLSFGQEQSVIDSDGRFTAQSMSFAIPNTVSFGTQTLDWHGKASTALSSVGTHILTDGSLTGDGLDFKVPETMQVSADHVDWQGNTRMLSAILFSRVADGRLIARNPRVEIAGTPTGISADRFSFNGQYAERPDTDNDQLRLTVTGNAAGRDFAVTNTAIDAPWVDAMQVQADDIDINSLNHIGFDTLKASGVRMLGDTNTNSAVLQAVTMNADQFALADLGHYSLRKLVIGGANVHTRRDASGMGVISEFMQSMSGGSSSGSQASGQGSSEPAHNSAGQQSSSTFVLDHLQLKGPALAFVDTTMSPAVRITGSNLDFTLDGLNTASPEQDASYQLSADIGAYGHFDSRGTIAPLAPGGPNMDLNAWLRSLALAPLSGYLDAAMGRKIANGAADGTLDLSASHGELKGELDTTIANFRLANSATKQTDIAFGISMNTALKLLRGSDDLINFDTKIVGDVTNPYFSINNLVREAVLAGLRTALLSDYSPVGLLNNAKNKFLNLFRSVEDRPAFFAPGKHYVQPDDRKYLTLIAKGMTSHPDWTLHIAGQAVPADTKPMNLDGATAAERHARLEALARKRQGAIRDYLAARNVNPDRILASDPSVLDSTDARPAVTFSLDKK
ncbi:DUF748 domain-containing protein [Salinisphaera sp. SPP-AMP-43]|uniref:DUF748 domain-containing protein n=1 Tax=Salinisphaera sp. SPP-AMP-43 TaxID=3121288 RepID=UPI003C6E5813